MFSLEAVRGYTGLYIWLDVTCQIILEVYISIGYAKRRPLRFLQVLSPSDPGRQEEMMEIQVCRQKNRRSENSFLVK